MNEYARLTRQDIDEKKRHCEECETIKRSEKGREEGRKEYAGYSDHRK